MKGVALVATCSLEPNGDLGKQDIEKAFENVCWDFQINVIGRLEFGQHVGSGLDGLSPQLGSLSWR